ncbi:MAG TPA: thioredoxin family protein [Desulfovibrio sp.]|uniref:thioredoxin family protein n=1 Tax=Desulfovibrio sp. TaxID=885 RepID=UPI002D1D406D|nr:thioredoxin family protein [Desulfovibrio sp.]HMM37536.1 thioredoxin family protein [Desulfovibrio sp.]
MKRAFRPLFLFACALLLALVLAPLPAAASDPVPQVPAPGRVTLVDLGAQSCIPCKMMAPILKELEQEYRDRAAVVVIDVWVHDDQVDRFNLRAIPTQIVYDRTGKEVFRHEGFLSKENLRKILDPLLER